MLQDIILRLIIFFLPTQLGLHFWPDFSRLAGIKIDYLSPTLYFTDCLIIFYLAISISQLRKALKKQKVIPLVTFAIFNIFIAVNPQNTFFQYLHVTEYYLFYLVLIETKNLWSKISLSLKLSFYLVISVQLLQFVKQESLDGAFYYLGERFFAPSSPNLPHVNFFGHFLIRVPSLFSHPNSLSGYLLIIYFLLGLHKKSLIYKITSLLSLTITFSKSAYFAATLLISKIRIGKSIIIIFTMLSLIQIFIPKLNTGIYSIDSRSAMIAHFKNQSFKTLILGSGLGNYTVTLSTSLPGSMQTIGDLQPVHNTLLLLISELGVIATTAIIYLIYKNYHKKYYPLLLIVLITALFDHYWVTSPQNKLAIILCFALLKETGQAGS